MTLEELQSGKILLIDKPLDWTSFDVVNKIRWEIRKKYHLKKFKVGHAGTLDPKATGLLILCLGKETKNIETYQGQEKIYTGTIKLGVTTPSYDTETEEEGNFPIDHISKELIKKTLPQFTGTIQQYPPIFSALKKEGKRLYEFARAGKEVEVKPRQIHIQNFEITSTELPYLDFNVTCSKGTYIRSLAHDFGKALNSGGYLTALRREQIGNFTIQNAFSIEKAIEIIQEGYDF
ncbi:tRNA pseudouridine(55) synthase [Flavobacteriaceae bacterium UJ101]|nr:tRNA pseudouridine(55) synthase [Flavobacteriaceae bacterium UJ101]